MSYLCLQCTLYCCIGSKHCDTNDAHIHRVGGPPLSLQDLLERQWQQTAQYILDQAGRQNNGERWMHMHLVYMYMCMQVYLNPCIRHVPVHACMGSASVLDPLSHKYIILCILRPATTPSHMQESG